MVDLVLMKTFTEFLENVVKKAKLKGAKPFSFLEGRHVNPLVLSEGVNLFHPERVYYLKNF